MNVYDFDKTIYEGDSTLDFYLFSLKRKPNLIRYLPFQVWGFLGYLFGIYTKIKFKEIFYSFLNGIDCIDEFIEIFWQQKSYKIKEWYLINKRNSDVIISASPEFLLKPICEILKIENLIASKVNKNTGICEGENCYGQEKVNQFKKKFGYAYIDKFYSDSLSDKPLADLADKKYLVDGNDIIIWNEYKPNKLKKLKMIFFTKQFMKFLIVGVINTFNGIIFSYIFSILLDVNISFILGYVAAMTISYILNSVLVFTEKLKINKYLKFCISYIPNFIIQNVFVIVFYNILNWNKIIVFILAAIIGVPITFIIMKLYAFNHNSIANKLKL